MTGLTEALVRLLRRIGPWVIPHRPYLALCARIPALRNGAHGKEAGAESARPAPQLLARSATLRNVYAGARCFVLCNGPSVRNQNLSPLQGEAVISVSSGYHHSLFGRIKPRYHCLPQITYGTFTEADAIAWFREMHANLGSAELFLNWTEEPLVRQHRLFPGRTVRYVWLHSDMDSMDGLAIPDLTQPIPLVQSVSIMCLMVAMYMGFRRIYLLGVDHDQFKTGEYKYFYTPTVLSGKDSDVAADGRVRTSRHDEFQALARLWRQYRRMRLVAEANGIEIFNATAGGELDEFPRVELASLFGAVAGAPAKAS